MKKYLKYFLVGILLIICCAKSGLAAEELTAKEIAQVAFEESLIESYVKRFGAGLSQEDIEKYILPAAHTALYGDGENGTGGSLTTLYCQCGGRDLTWQEMLDIDPRTGNNQTSTVAGRTDLFFVDNAEETLSVLIKERQKYNGAIVGTDAGKAFAALTVKINALQGNVQKEWYGDVNEPSDHLQGENNGEVIGSGEGLSIYSYNSVSGVTDTSSGFTVTDTSGNQTFITPTDVFVADSQKFSDSTATLLKKCLAACKTKGGSNSDCNKICNIARCGCLDTDSNGILETVCAVAQFGPVCISPLSCNIRMCDDPAVLKSLGNSTALNALVTKYYPIPTNTSNTNKNQGTGSSNDIQVSGISTSKKCNANGSCTITLLSDVDNQFQVAYLKWETGAQNATLVNSLMATPLSVVAGKPTKITLNLSVANELQLGDGTRVECLSCSGDMTLANRFSTGCDKAGETNPHAECKATYDCGSSVPRYGCWNFNYCGINQCNDYLPDKDGNKLQSADCKASNSGQKWKCDAITKTCETVNGSGVDTYTTQSECLSSLQCGGGGTDTERNTYYCCGAGGTCSLCTEGSNLYVNEAQCNNSCSKTTCPTGQTKCGSTCCRNIDQTCENYTTCRGTVTCSANGGTCCPNGCAGSTATGLCGGTGVSCCATGCK